MSEKLPPLEERPLVGVPLKVPTESRLFWLILGSGLLWAVTILGDLLPGLGVALPGWVLPLVAGAGLLLSVVKVVVRISDPDVVTRVPWLDVKNDVAPYFPPQKVASPPDRG